MIKNPPANAGDAGDMGSFPGLGRSPGGVNGNPFQYSCQDNFNGQKTWRATVHGLQKIGHDSVTNTHTHTHIGSV